jgi:hypothetical protein
MLITSHDAPILIVENDIRDWASLGEAVRHAGFDNPVLCLPNAFCAELYLAGRGEYSDRKEFPLPCLILMDVTLPEIIGMGMPMWLTPPPISRQIVITGYLWTLDPGQFESAVAFSPNSVLCKLSSPDSLARMIEELREIVIDSKTPLLARR